MISENELTNLPDQDKGLSEKKKVIHSLIFPTFMVFLFWFIFGIENILELDFYTWGIYPRELQGLKGIITSPFIHSDIKHIINNTLPFYILSISLFYFYRGISYEVFFFIFFMVGLWVWVGARPAYHIGASGLVYGLASFLFFSGIIKNIPSLTAISLLVVFLYGSMIWYVFPIKQEVSWESHLMGAVAGLILAFYYRKKGPQRKKYSWEIEEEYEDNENSINQDT